MHFYVLIDLTCSATKTKCKLLQWQTRFHVNKLEISWMAIPEFMRATRTTRLATDTLPFSLLTQISPTVLASRGNPSYRYHTSIHSSTMSLQINDSGFIRNAFIVILMDKTLHLEALDTAGLGSSETNQRSAKPGDALLKCVVLEDWYASGDRKAKHYPHLDGRDRLSFRRRQSSGIHDGQSRHSAVDGARHRSRRARDTTRIRSLLRPWKLSSAAFTLTRP